VRCERPPRRCAPPLLCKERNVIPKNFVKKTGTYSLVTPRHKGRPRQRSTCGLPLCLCVFVVNNQIRQAPVTPSQGCQMRGGRVREKGCEKTRMGHGAGSGLHGLSAREDSASRMRRRTRRWAPTASSSARRRFRQWIERERVCA